MTKNRNTPEFVSTFFDDILARINRMPDQIPSRGGRMIDGPLWKAAASKTVDELKAISHLIQTHGFDWLENEFNERIVSHYNESVDAHNAAA